MTITAAADGSALGNPGPAGWAWYVDEGCWRAGGWPHGTNNQGELMAVLDLFRSTRHVPDEHLRILCDSQYVINCITKWMPGWKRKGWKKADGKPVLNVDLLKQIDAEIKGRDYSFEWVKGHNGHDLNEEADDRARAAATAFQAGRAPAEGPGFTGASPGKRAEAVPAGEAPAGEAPEHTTTGASPEAEPFLEEPALFGAGPGDDFPDAAEDTDAGESAAQIAELGLGAGTGTGEPDEDFFAALGGAAVPALPSSDLDAVLALQAALLDREVRTDTAAVLYLLAPDFRGVSATGQPLDREYYAQQLAARPGSAELQLLESAALGTDLLQVIYRRFEDGAATVASALWERAGEGASRWRLRFQQESPES
ncbi:ribonuclease H [Zafaria cholistanensis]|uniref:ribonuclease H n=1 Tax=Zafaria cholistanensis TaxID=1682741 RepID=A0A5A7NVK1_9MICC|nr:RNase H family protein [Zafaria cholistanensis]GER24247.1 ribonuclease H [Zafaria cholistanensis]